MTNRENQKRRLCHSLAVLGWFATSLPEELKLSPSHLSPCSDSNQEVVRYSLLVNQLAFVLVF